MLVEWFEWSRNIIAVETQPLVLTVGFRFKNERKKKQIKKKNK